MQDVAPSHVTAVEAASKPTVAAAANFDCSPQNPSLDATATLGDTAEDGLRGTHSLKGHCFVGLGPWAVCRKIQDSSPVRNALMSVLDRLGEFIEFLSAIILGKLSCWTSGPLEVGLVACFSCFFACSCPRSRPLRTSFPWFPPRVATQWLLTGSKVSSRVSRVFLSKFALGHHPSTSSPFLLEATTVKYDLQYINLAFVDCCYRCTWILFAFFPLFHSFFPVLADDINERVFAFASVTFSICVVRVYTPRDSDIVLTYFSSAAYRLDRMRTSAGATWSGDRLFYGDIQGKKHILVSVTTWRRRMPCHGFEVASWENFHTLTVQFSPDLLLAHRAISLLASSLTYVSDLNVGVFNQSSDAPRCVHFPQTASSRSQCSWQRHPLKANGISS